MKKWLLLFLLASPTVVRAELVQPNFTQGSMNSTTTTTVDIEEEIVTRAASQIIEKTEIDRTIEQESTTVSLSVFSQ